MPHSKSLASYKVETEALNKALESPLGARVTFKEAKQAIAFRHRCHEFRALDRKFNAEIYPPGHPMHGNSPYDDLIIRLVGPVVTIVGEGRPVIEEITVGPEEK